MASPHRLNTIYRGDFDPLILNTLTGTYIARRIAAVTRRRPPATRHEDATRTSRSTVVWGDDVERNDFLKLPRVLTRLGSYSEIMGRGLQPRHVVLMLNLAGRRFQDEPLRVEWRDVARDLGTKADTVRHWAYELRELRLLKIRQLLLNDGGRRRRGRGVELDISPFVELVRIAYVRRRETRRNAAEKGEPNSERTFAEADMPF